MFAPTLLKAILKFCTTDKLFLTFVLVSYFRVKRALQAKLTKAEKSKLKYKEDENIAFKLETEVVNLTSGCR